MNFPGVVRRAGNKLGRVLLVAASAFTFAAAAAAAPLTFTVNSTDDALDFNPGNGICETVAGNGACTLRAAIIEANAHAGADTIILQANVTYLLSRVGEDDTALNGDLDVLDSVTITGAGPSTVIDGNGAVVGDRVFFFAHCIGGGFTVNGICPNGDVVATMSGVTIQHGYAANNGGGIANGADLTLQTCIVTANTVNGLNDWGGGILSYGTLTLTGTVVSNNVSGGHNAYGGGIYVQGSMTIDSSTISGNVTSGSLGLGGGIEISSSLNGKQLITNSTISGNSATTGGGIYTTSSSLTLVNTTISANGSTGDGGGVYSKYGPIGLYNATIVNNTANTDEIKPDGIGAGVYNAAGATMYLANSIIAGNAVLVATGMKPIRDPDQCFGSISSLGHNLLSDIDLDHCSMGGYALAALAFGPLQNTGGPTKTHALLPGSAAIDAGNMAGCVDGDGAPIATDQRGQHRPYGPYCDVGAFEASDAIFFNRFEIGV
ncbi:MAG TPA: choice-of-anchor Q domain-containing protein [Rhodanobacteraceae bacterium]|nr:choice-of-anchor Q domain-containing protein [Rhodanobacteraceae bacterium]